MVDEQDQELNEPGEQTEREMPAQENDIEREHSNDERFDEEGARY